MPSYVATVRTGPSVVSDTSPLAGSLVSDSCPIPVSRPPGSYVCVSPAEPSIASDVTRPFESSVVSTDPVTGPDQWSESA